ncbi:general odorant-binding protein 70 [Stomoxys calcitrans]|uniref:general odorant-binding protein 70 n=1 Tax=Stomoxys calcitrans TaxID=35570 RepID=UPI0027E22583|nr:general odorant-binding protein 70 [Stomoxys calcitrans]
MMALVCLVNLVTVCVLFVNIIKETQGYDGLHQYYELSTKKTRCLNPPRTARKVETYIKECQDEVRNKLVQEAYSILKHEVYNVQPPVDPHDDKVELIDTIHAISTLDHGDNHNHYEYITLEEGEDVDTPRKRMARLVKRIARVDDISNGIYHPTLVPFEDKRIAGCLLHCVYAKNNAIDKKGWPTLDGLVDFYSGGVNEHGFFMATLRSVNLCLRAVTNKYHVDRHKFPEKGESCDLAFDVFDCISDLITGYCMDQYKTWP